MVLQSYYFTLFFYVLLCFKINAIYCNLLNQTINVLLLKRSYSLEPRDIIIGVSALNLNTKKNVEEFRMIPFKVKEHCKFYCTSMHFVFKSVCTEMFIMFPFGPFPCYHKGGFSRYIFETTNNCSKTARHRCTTTI